MPEPEMAVTPQPPYYAVVFTSIRRPTDADAYAVTAERMVELAHRQPGFLGIDSVRGSDGLSITVSYWESLETIRAWKQHAEHRLAQQAGREQWYRAYELRIARVEHAYGFDADA